MSDKEKRDLDVYLRFMMPELPEDYGAPVDGVRLLVKDMTLKYERPESLLQEPRGRFTVIPPSPKVKS